MSIKFDQETIRRGEALYVDFPENIVVEPELNGRHEHTDIEALAADIEAHGQNTPVVIRKNDQGMPVLVFGHRRYRAIALLNQLNPNSPRKIICKYEKLTETEAFIAAIGENRFRRDVSPIDDCANICLLRKRFGMSMEDIAKVYFPEARKPDELADALKFVKQRAALEELAPEAAQAVRNGRVKITAAIALAKLSADQQRKKVAGDGKVKGSTVTPAKVKAAIEVVPVAEVMPDPELRRLVGELLEDEGLADTMNDERVRYVEVDRRALMALAEFMELTSN